MITSLPAATSGEAGSAVFDRWMYASSSRTIASFGLLATRYSMSSLGVIEPVGIVGIADVDQAGVGVGLGHGLDVVRAVLAERDRDRLGTDEARGPLAGLVTGVGDDVALARPGEGQHGPMQGVARAGERHDVIARKALDFGHRRRRTRRSRHRDSGRPCGTILLDRLDRLGAGAHRVFVGVDPHRVGRKVRQRREPLGQRRLVVEGQGRARGQEGRQPAEVAAAESAADEIST